jgi:[ribosomal protein S5]-alanine N-acetyltransferase
MGQETMFPEIVETERLVLRWAQEGDAEEMFARYASDPVVARYMLWLPHKSAEGTREWLRLKLPDREQGRSFNWLIRLRSNNTMLGSIGCSVDRHTVEFGYCLAQDRLGQRLCH